MVSNRLGFSFTREEVELIEDCLRQRSNELAENEDRQSYAARTSVRLANKLLGRLARK